MSLVFLEENKKAVLSSVEDLLKGLNLYFEDKEGFLLAIQKINNLVEDYYKIRGWEKNGDINEQKVRQSGLINFI